MHIAKFSVYSWCHHSRSLTTHHNLTGGRGYPEFCAAWLESTTRCHRIYSTVGRRVRWNIFTRVIIYFFYVFLSYTPALQSHLFTCLHLSDIGQDVSVTLPAASSSYQVTGLRLGRRYRFTVQPTFASGFGTESSVDERTGNTPACALSYTHHTYKHLLTPYLTLLTFLSTVCVGGRLDVVFLVPASTDRISLERPLRKLLTSAAGSLNTIGARDSQVLLFKNKCKKKKKKVGCELPTLWLFSACFRWAL